MPEILNEMGSKYPDKTAQTHWSSFLYNIADVKI